MYWFWDELIIEEYMRVRKGKRKSSGGGQR
jgi:hypothetical protein